MGHPRTNISQDGRLRRTGTVILWFLALAVPRKDKADLEPIPAPAARNKEATANLASHRCLRTDRVIGWVMVAI